MDIDRGLWSRSKPGWPELSSYYSTKALWEKSCHAYFSLDREVKNFANQEQEFENLKETMVERGEERVWKPQSET